MTIQKELDFKRNPLDISNASLYFEHTAPDSTVQVTNNTLAIINLKNSEGEPTSFLVSTRGHLSQTTTGIPELMELWGTANSTNDWTTTRETIEQILINHKFVCENNQMDIYLAGETFFMAITSDFILNLNAIKSLDYPKKDTLKTSQTNLTTTEALLVNIPLGLRSIYVRLDRAIFTIISVQATLYGKVDDNDVFSFKLKLPPYLKPRFHKIGGGALIISRKEFIKIYNKKNTRKKSQLEE